MLEIHIKNDGDLKDVKVSPKMEIKKDAPMKTIIELVASSPDPHIDFLLEYN
jgi:hypothetical protein